MDDRDPSRDHEDKDEFLSLILDLENGSTFFSTIPVP